MAVNSDPIDDLVQGDLTLLKGHYSHIESRVMYSIHRINALADLLGIDLDTLNLATHERVTRFEEKYYGAK